MKATHSIFDRRTGQYRPAILNNGVPQFFVDEAGVDYRPSHPRRIATLTLSGEIISDDATGAGIRAGDVIARLDSIRPGSVDEIRFRICSTGGDFASAKRIIAAIEARPEMTVAEIGRQAHSGALLIALACRQRSAASDSSMMMHAVSAGGCIASTRRQSAWSAEFINRRTGIALNQVATWLDHNGGGGIYLDFKMAERLGIVTMREITGTKALIIPEGSRPFVHDGPHIPAACRCAQCQKEVAAEVAALRAQNANSVTEPWWNSAQSRFVHPIEQPVIPARLRGKIFLSHSDYSAAAGNSGIHLPPHARAAYDAAHKQMAAECRERLRQMQATAMQRAMQGR